MILASAFALTVALFPLGATPRAEGQAAPSTPSTPSTAALPTFIGSVTELPAEVAAKARRSSWREGCPVPLGDMRYLKVSFWGFDDAAHEGELIVNQSVANEVVNIFRALFAAHFAIQKMRLIDEYGGDDGASMADNNTSAFNCRDVAGKKGVFSKHSYGRAIDLNPLTNPFVTKDGIDPPAGAAFADRTQKAKGMIVEGDTVCTTFLSQGWAWGGAWKSMKDYQHFEKKSR